MINEPNDLVVKRQAARAATAPTNSHASSDSGQVASDGRLALFGGSILVILAFAGAAIVTQMSGCCGGAPTHACKFVETADAHQDMSSDMMLPCGTTQVCEPGVSFCCLEAESEPPLRCVPIGQVCSGPPANCSGDQDCPAGAGLHCCGHLDTMQIQCEAVCSGDYLNDQTARICRGDAECPPERPKCAFASVGGMVSFFVCQKTGT